MYTVAAKIILNSVVFGTLFVPLSNYVIPLSVSSNLDCSSLDPWRFACFL